jgi:hypothetical protein
MEAEGNTASSVIASCWWAIGKPALQATQRFFAGLAFGPFAFVIGPALAFGIADLGHGHDVQGMVDPSVARAGKPVADLVAVKTTMT